MLKLVIVNVTHDAKMTTPFAEGGQRIDDPFALSEVALPSLPLALSIASKLLLGEGNAQLLRHRL